MNEYKDLIYDIGAHTGRDTEFYLKKGFRVVAVEANPSLCEQLNVKFKEFIKSERLFIVNKAIYNDAHINGGFQSRFVKFLIHKHHDDWGTIKSGWNRVFEDEIEEIEVETTQPGWLYEQYGIPYYMKIDIEGADIECIRELSPDHLPTYLSAELLTYNNILGENVNNIEIINDLVNLGYTKFQLVDQSKNYKTKCPNPPSEGTYVDYKFDGTCSGLFGKELPDKWSTFDNILFQYIHYYRRTPNCCGESLDDNGWFDIHCTK